MFLNFINTIHSEKDFKITLKLRVNNKISISKNIEHEIIYFYFKL